MLYFRAPKRCRTSRQQPKVSVGVNSVNAYSNIPLQQINSPSVKTRSQKPVEIIRGTKKTPATSTSSIPIIVIQDDDSNEGPSSDSSLSSTSKHVISGQPTMPLSKFRQTCRQTKKDFTSNYFNNVAKSKSPITETKITNPRIEQTCPKRLDFPNVDDDDFLSSLEKSVCSSDEKLCPSCKCIVSISLFSDHLRKCFSQFKCKVNSASTSEVRSH